VTVSRISLIPVSALALAGALAVCGCSGGTTPGDEAEAVVVARVGDHRVTRGEFDAYLSETLGSPQGAAAAEPAVKSRLLDQFLEEELLVTAAEKKGITVSEPEIDRAAREGGRDRDRVRRALLERKFKQQVILNDVSVADEEARAYFESHIESFHRPARVVLRKVLLDSAAEARQVRDELAKDPGRFEDVASARSLSPDGGQPQAYEEDSLPESIRRAADQLGVGEISPVVEDPQGFFILQLEQRQPERAANLEDAFDRIKLDLLREKSQARYREFVDALRRDVPVEVFQDKLPFRYVERKG